MADTEPGPGELSGMHFHRSIMHAAELLMAECSGLPADMSALRINQAEAERGVLGGGPEQTPLIAIISGNQSTEPPVPGGAPRFQCFQPFLSSVWQRGAGVWGCGGPVQLHRPVLWSELPAAAGSDHSQCDAAALAAKTRTRALVKDT